MAEANFLDGIAGDLSQWIDQTADEVARAFAPGRAPFAPNISQEKLLEIYRAQLFNPDGSPNMPGREAQIKRLGAEQFSAIYKAVVSHWPELKPPPEPPTEIPEQWPTPAPPGMPPPGPPPMPMPPPMPGPPLPLGR